MNKTMTKILKIVLYTAAVISLLAMIGVIILSTTGGDGSKFKSIPVVSSVYSFINTTPGYLCCIFVPFIILIISLGINAFLNISIAGKAAAKKALESGTDSSNPAVLFASDPLKAYDDPSKEPEVTVPQPPVTAEPEKEKPSNFGMGFSFGKTPDTDYFQEPAEAPEAVSEDTVLDGLNTALNDAVRQMNTEDEQETACVPDSLIWFDIASGEEPPPDTDLEIPLEAVEFVLDPGNLSDVPEFIPEFNTGAEPGIDSGEYTGIDASEWLNEAVITEDTVPGTVFEAAEAAVKIQNAEEEQTAAETGAGEIPAIEDIAGWLNSAVIADGAVSENGDVLTEEFIPEPEKVFVPEPVPEVSAEEPVSDFDADALAMLAAVIGNTETLPAPEKEPENTVAEDTISKTVSQDEPSIYGEEPAGEIPVIESVTDWLNDTVIINDEGQAHEEKQINAVPETDSDIMPAESSADLNESDHEEPAAQESAAAHEKPEEDQDTVNTNDVWAQLAAVVAEKEEIAASPVFETPITDKTGIADDTTGISSDAGTAVLPGLFNEPEYIPEPELTVQNAAEYHEKLSGSEFERRLWEGVDDVLAGRDLMQPDIISDVLPGYEEAAVTDGGDDGSAAALTVGGLTDATHLFDCIDTIDDI